MTDIKKPRLPFIHLFLITLYIINLHFLYSYLIWDKNEEETGKIIRRKRQSGKRMQQTCNHKYIQKRRHRIYTLSVNIEKRCNYHLLSASIFYDPFLSVVQYLTGYFFYFSIKRFSILIERIKSNTKRNGFFVTCLCIL